MASYSGSGPSTSQAGPSTSQGGPSTSQGGPSTSRVVPSEISDEDYKMTEVLITKYINSDVYDCLVDKLGLTQVQDKEGKFCGRPFKDPGLFVSFPFEILCKNDVNDDTYEKRRFIAKVIPEMSSDFKKITRNIFQRDGIISETVLGLINECLVNKGFETVKFPTLYYSNFEEEKELLVFEDFCSDTSELRFKIDYSRTLNYASATLVMKTLARFHGGFHLLEATHGNIETLCPILKISVEKEAQREIVKGMLHNNAFLLEQWGGYEDLVSQIRNAADNNMIFQHCLSSFKPSTKYRTLSHGSIGGNPIYFSQDKDQVCLNFFGGSGISSLAADINNIIFTCLDSHTRMTKRGQLFDTYHKVYKNILEAGQCAVTFTSEELHKEVLSMLTSGWFAAMTSLPSYVGGYEYNYDLSFSFSNLTEFTEDNRRVLRNLFYRNCNYSQRFVEMYKDLHSFGVLSEFR